VSKRILSHPCVRGGLKQNENLIEEFFSENNSESLPVSVLYKNKDMDLTAKLEAGFGPDSLGIIAIAEVPKYKELRHRLLPLASHGLL
jgi:hypothetical protein